MFILEIKILGLIVWKAMADILVISNWGVYIVYNVSSKEGSAIRLCSSVVSDDICGW